MGDESKVHHFEKRALRKDGNTIWLRFKVSRCPQIINEESGFLVEASETTPLRAAQETGDKLLKSYKDLFDASNDLAFILSRAGKIIDLNQVALDYFSLNASDVIGTSITDYAGQRTKNIASIKEAFEDAWNGTPQRFEWWAKLVDKETPQEAVISKAAYLGEQVLIASFRDIHERIASEKKLHEQEAMLRLVTENSTDAVSLFDATQQLVYISPVIEKMIGFTPDELVQLGFHQLIHPEDQRAVKVEIDGSIARQQTQSRYKFRQQKKDGSYCWLEVNALRRYDDQGKIIQTIANLRDVDEQVEAETKLKESERFLAETQRLAQIGSWEYHLHRDEYKFSPEFLHLLHLTEAKAKSPDALLQRVSAEHRKLLSEKLAALLKDGNGFNIDFTIELDDGSQRSLNGIGYAERDAEGRIPRVRGAIIDITKRKSTERVLRGLKERAERAATVKQQFLSNMSHELRTPLNAVLGMTNLLKIDKPRKDQLEKIKLLEYSAENLLHIINDILDFSALEEQHLQLNPEPVELDVLMNNVIHLFTEKAREKSLELKLNIEDTPSLIIADKFRLNQILFNIIGNAIKFTDEGEVAVSVSVKNEEESKLVFEISDTGIGIDASEFEDIFDRFHQSKLGGSFRLGGTGLGLSITKGLLELMESEIKLTSELGKGSTFSFELELLEPSNTKLEEPEAEYKTDQSGLSNLKVLVAEDNTINQFVVTKILSRWSIKPVVVENGQRVLDLILEQGEHFDIILIDLQMPVMDGIEATQLLRRNGIKTPIIAITAAVLPDQRNHVIESGMDDFIGKPFKPQELKEALLRHSVQVNS